MAISRLLFLATLCLVSAGCASTHRASQSSIVTSWDYAADHPNVWSAALAALRAIGFSTESVNEADAEIAAARSLQIPGLRVVEAGDPLLVLELDGGAQG